MSLSDADLNTTLDVPDAATIHRARMSCAVAATDAADLRRLLDMLDLRKVADGE